jgi:hypothetical protein
MATRVWESAVINAAVDTVWGLIRPLTFAFNTRVAGAEVEDKKSASEVGAVVRVTYKDGTVQRLKVVEISDAGYSVSWDVVESIPAVTVMAATHTVKLRRVTDVNATFIEWTTDFSKDAGLDVIQDARYKQKEAFTAVAAAAGAPEAKEAPAKRPLIGGPAGVYNPAVARQGVVDLWNELQALQKAADDHANLTAPALSELSRRYKALPITWMPNWALAGLTSEGTQVVADDVRTKLNAAKTRLGDNSLPLPRLFQV